MTRRTRHGAVAGLAVLGVLLAGCTDDAPDPDNDEPSAAQVLDRLGEHPEALDDGALDEGALDDLVAAGGDDDAAEQFRSRYLAHVEDGVDRTIRDAGRDDWPATLETIDEVWIQPSAEVIGALEAGCDQSGGTCDDRLDQAELELRDAIESGTYAAMPAKLLPRAFIEDGERVAMSGWSARQRDAWQRLRNTTLLPQTTGVVERAALARRQDAGA
jgi:hypothetical protein